MPFFSYICSGNIGNAEREKDMLHLNDIEISIMLAVVAFLVTTLVYPHVLAFARRHQIVDNPDARKLQRVPVPVMGGATIFIGFSVAVLILWLIAGDPRLPRLYPLLLTMFLLGWWDDVKDVSASLRFIVEVMVTWLLMVFVYNSLNSFHGLWGIYELPELASIPLSLLAGVGIMNAVNMIDGVDGYCSAFGMMASLAFAVIFLISGDLRLFALSLSMAGALVPFFLHNVFGRKSKMFLGDGGSLLLGTLLVFFVFKTISAHYIGPIFDSKGLSLPALCLAILAVPVFDTLKVMLFRIIHGRSPFQPDKTHLHHLFIEMQFSHVATSLTIVLGNLLIIGLLLLSWQMGASIEMQVYLVVGLAMLFTWAFYFWMEHEHRKNDGQGSPLFQRMQRIGRKTDLTSTALWRFICRVVDSRFLAGAPEAEPDEKEIPRD